MKRLIIACEVMKAEFDLLLEGRTDVDIVYLEQGLHDYPEKMPAEIQNAIDGAGPDVSEIVLAYGLCSNGTVGLKSDDHPLIIPRIHDCITMIIGSKVEFMRVFNETTGTLFLSPGWLDYPTLDLDVLMEKYTEKFGREKAVLYTKMTYENYRKILMIDTNAGDRRLLNEKAERFAEFLDIELEKIEGSHEFLLNIINGNYPEEDFICLKPGERSTQEAFLR